MLTEDNAAELREQQVASHHTDGASVEERIIVASLRRVAMSLACVAQHMRRVGGVRGDGGARL